jgi:hypothetical protein
VVVLGGGATHFTRGQQVAKSQLRVGADGGSDPKAVAAVTNLLREGNLRLSSDDRLTRHFRAMVRVGFKTRDGKTQGTTYLLHREEDRVAILLLSEEGLAYCLMTNGLVAAFDPAQPGRLLVHQGGNPSFSLGSDVLGARSLCDISYDTRAARASAMLDFSSLLSASLQKTTRARWDEKTRSAELKTDHAVVSVELSPLGDSHVFPIKNLTMLGTRGDSLAAGSISIEPRSAAKVLGVDKAKITAAGLQVKTVGTEEAARFQTTIPLDFGKNAREKAAAQQFLNLFFDDSK